MTLVKRALPLVIAALPAVPAAAQQARKPKSSKPLTEQDLATARPGRDPNQPIDEDYTKKIKEYTTETFFLSPVHRLPARRRRTVPTPKAVLATSPGPPGKPARTRRKVNDYMRLARQVDAARQGLLDRQE
jgi:hypothetical protein